MGYTDFQESQAYKSRQPGAGVRVVLVDLSTKKNWIAHAGITPSETVEQNSIREAGEKEPSELVTGAREVSLAIEGNWTADINDNELPGRTTFLEKRFDVYSIIAPDFPGAGTVLDYWHDFRPQSVTRGSHGNSGVLPFSMNGPARYHQTGAEWAVANGQT